MYVRSLILPQQASTFEWRAKSYSYWQISEFECYLSAFASEHSSWRKGMLKIWISNHRIGSVEIWPNSDGKRICGGYLYLYYEYMHCVGQHCRIFGRLALITRSLATTGRIWRCLSSTTWHNEYIHKWSQPMKPAKTLSHKRQILVIHARGKSNHLVLSAVYLSEWCVVGPHCLVNANAHITYSSGIERPIGRVYIVQTRRSIWSMQRL